jgi:low affinity Fe/Cu permease
MKKQKEYFMLTLVISVLVGIILPLLGVKDFTIITITFCSVWFIYAVVFFINTFLIKGRRLKKKFDEGEKDDSFSPRDIQELQALYEITIKKKDWDRNKRLWS